MKQETYNNYINCIFTIIMNKYKKESNYYFIMGYCKKVFTNKNFKMNYYILKILNRCFVLLFNCNRLRVFFIILLPKLYIN